LAEPTFKEIYNFFFSVVQQPNLVLDPLTVEVYRSHAIRHTHTSTVELHWNMSNPFLFPCGAAVQRRQWPPHFSVF